MPGSRLGSLKLAAPAANGTVPETGAKTPLDPARSRTTEVAVVALLVQERSTRAPAAWVLSSTTLATRLLGASTPSTRIAAETESPAAL